MKKKRRSSKKAQAMTETLIIAGVILVILIPLAMFGFGKANVDTRLNQAQIITDTIAAKMTSLSRAAPGSVSCVKLRVPRGVISATVAGHDVIMNIEAKSEINNVNSKSSGGIFYYGFLPLTSPGLTEVCISNNYNDGTYRTNDIGVIYTGRNLPTPAAGDGCQIITPYLVAGPDPGTEDPDCADTEISGVGGGYGSGGTGGADNLGYFNTEAGSAFISSMPTCGNGILEGNEVCEFKEDCFADLYGWVCFMCECWGIDKNAPGGPGGGVPPGYPGRPGDPEDPIPPPPPSDPGVPPACSTKSGHPPFIGIQCCDPSKGGTDCTAVPGPASCVVSPICDYSIEGLTCGVCVPKTRLIEDGDYPGTTNAKDDDDPSNLASQMFDQLSKTSDFGDQSIKLESLAGLETGTFTLQTPMPLVNMGTFEFDIRGHHPGDTPVYITFEINSVSQSTQVNINSYIQGGGLTNSEYRTMIVPLLTFEVDTSPTSTDTITAITFEGEPNNPTYYDNIVFRE